MWLLYSDGQQKALKQGKEIYLMTTWIGAWGVAVVKALRY